MKTVTFDLRDGGHDGPRVHGTPAAYSRGCRCDDCRAASNAKQRALRWTGDGNRWPEFLHGGAFRYVVDGCRCELCVIEQAYRETEPTVEAIG